MVIIHDVALIETNEVGAIMTDVGPYNTDMVIIEGDMKKDRMFPHNHLYFLSKNKFYEGEFVCDGTEIIESTSKLVNAQGLVDRRNWRKVVAATDEGLGLPLIHKDFVNEYIENPVETVDLYAIWPESRTVEFNDLFEFPLSYRLEKGKHYVATKSVKNNFKRKDIMHALAYALDQTKKGVSHDTIVRKYKAQFM